jgi:hypothetical protein
MGAKTVLEGKSVEERLSMTMQRHQQVRLDVAFQPAHITIQGALNYSL